MKLEYDIIVVGGGHAGCEAAAAAARLGSSTLLISMDMGKYAQMSCNPAIGGVAKGQIVREIDALGGQMGIITDKTTIQFRMLNRSKGPAMWSPRAQCDKAQFSLEWRKTLENTPNLSLWQDSVTSLSFTETTEHQSVTGVITSLGVTFKASAGDASSYGLSDQLEKIGFEKGRMKTGTPARLDGRTIDFSKLEPQSGDEIPSKFSYLTEIQPVSDQLPCYIVHTSLAVHDTLRTGFADSPLFNGTIKGIGPRYCPSIEDKLRTFADKDSHLPWQVQIEALSKIEGLENVQIYRPGYAIEYDYFPPTQLHHTLETKLIENLYFAGQINGTTGYEEAGAQGLMAGINAHLKLNGKEQIVLRRDEAYIGVLIDDLVTKGVDEPYRMFTSRAEYRILLRQDNADARLTPIGYKIGLVNEKRHAIYQEKKSLVESLIKFTREQSISPSEINNFLKSVNSAQITQSKKLFDILLRNEITINNLKDIFRPISEFLSTDNYTEEIISEAEIQIKYKGYIERERFMAEKLLRLENIAIPSNFDFNSLSSLTIEARQKLSRIKPSTIGQASRIPGVSPADINVLLIFFGR